MSNLAVIRYKPKYLKQMVKLFVKEYSKIEDSWSAPKAKQFILRDIRRFPEYCLLAIDKKSDKLIGYILGRVDPLCTEDYLGISSLQVCEPMRRKGLAKRLLFELISFAKKRGLSGVLFIMDSRMKHTKKWYERMGFEPSGWVEYEARMEQIKT